MSVNDGELISPSAKVVDNAKAVKSVEPPPTKLFSVYHFVGDGGLSKKGLGIFILCLTIAVVAFIIYTALR